MSSRDGERSSRQYDAMALDYARHNAHSASNALYERPATIALLGPVAGLRVLEVGCGSGPLTEYLVEAGAEVVAFDVSPRMARLARERLGERAQIHVADAAERLGFASDHSMDVIVASLVVHYLADWVGLLDEFRRILRPSGCVVLSTHHPERDMRLHPEADYFKTELVHEVWVCTHPVSFWRRPLSRITGPIADAGFVIERLVEAQPLAELETRDPAMFVDLSTLPNFLHLRLRPVGADGSVFQQ
jgi:ubiquinone/menaquinone biosynthesis C-methylase UbiE